MQTVYWEVGDQKDFQPQVIHNLIQPWTPPSRNSSTADVQLPASLQASGAPSRPYYPDPAQLDERHRPPGPPLPSEPLGVLVVNACCLLTFEQCSFPPVVGYVHTLVLLVHCFAVLSFQLFAYPVAIVVASFGRDRATLVGCFRLVAEWSQSHAVHPSLHQWLQQLFRVYLVDLLLKHILLKILSVVLMQTGWNLLPCRCAPIPMSRSTCGGWRRPLAPSCQRSHICHLLSARLDGTSQLSYGNLRWIRWWSPRWSGAINLEWSRRHVTLHLSFHAAMTL